MEVARSFRALIVPLILVQVAAAQVTLETFPGVINFEGFGGRVASLRDIDADGYPDVIIAAITSPHETVRVYSGRTATLLYQFTYAGISAAYSVADAGDVDADGHSDFIIGTRDEITASGRGVVRVYSGATGAVLYTYLAQSQSDNLGESVAGVGDINGDGHDDFIIGANGNDTVGAYAGRARVFSGIDGSTLYSFDGAAAGDSFGQSVAGCGDVNADGTRDFIVGAPQYSTFGVPKGYARVYSGATGAVLYTFVGVAYQDRFGENVAGAGDVDGDGHADLIIGAPLQDVGHNDNGAARVFSGATGAVMYTRAGGTNNAWASVVAGGSDYDGDGLPDVIVGSPHEAQGVGVVRIYRGFDGTLLQSFTGVPYVGFGSSVAFAGDFDHNGDVDVLIGVPGGDTTGEAIVYSRTPYVFDRLCPTTPNSVGPGARIDHTGTSSLAANNLVLTGDGLPALKPGLFFYGNSVLQVPFADGVRCASGQMLRLPVVQSDALGNAAYAVDYLSPFTQTGVFTAGSTWYFQMFYRDTGFGTYGLNTSDALAIGFRP